MRRKVLVIDDNEQNTYLVSFLLEKNGYQVISARDGKEGLDMALREKPDLILLDILLPIMDGYQVARALREHAASATIPVFALTSCAMVGDRERILASGCTSYLEKPIDPDTFVDDLEPQLRTARG